MPIPATWSSRLLSVMRIVVALVFFSHGISKFFGLPPFPMPMNPLLTVAGALEVVGGGLLIIGLSGMSAVAYFMAHMPKGPFPIANGGEAAVLYCFVFLYLAAAGGGVWSVDAQRGRG
jgi:putative oxidoreductase